MRKIFNIKCFFILIFIHTISSYGQQYVSLKYVLEGEKIDTLRIATRDTSGNLFTVYGKTNDHINWLFKIPVEIWNRLDRFVLGNADEKQKIRKYEYINFLYKSPLENKQNLSYRLGDIPCYVPDWDNINMKAEYLNSDTVFVEEDSVQLIYHNFQAKPLLQSGMEAWVKCPDFSMFSDSYTNENYLSKLTEYRDIVRQYPDSRLLLIKLSENITQYHSQTDAKTVFDLFSAKNKESFFGKKISDQLQINWTHFDNISLTNYQNNQKELVVQDTTALTLISFTASWCVYCKKEIPILKQIYNDLIGCKFNMVYIDVDDSNTIQTFVNEMNKESISWRSLLSYPLQNEMQKKYAKNGIPVNILVYSNGRAEYLDIRNIAERNKLIETVKSTNR